ncbi:MAG TPA: hypothetical protein VF049_14655 [Nocardioidaceae bacterium]
MAFPQLSDDVGNWGESPGVVCVVTEALLVARRVGAPHESGRPVPGSAAACRLVLVPGALVTTYAATAGG